MESIGLRISSAIEVLIYWGTRLAIVAIILKVLLNLMFILAPTPYGMVLLIIFCFVLSIFLGDVFSLDIFKTNLNEFIELILSSKYFLFGLQFTITTLLLVGPVYVLLVESVLLMILMGVLSLGLTLYIPIYLTFGDVMIRLIRLMVVPVASMGYYLTVKGLIVAISRTTPTVIVFEMSMLLLNITYKNLHNNLLTLFPIGTGLFIVWVLADRVNWSELGRLSSYFYLTTLLAILIASVWTFRYAKKVVQLFLVLLASVILWSVLYTMQRSFHFDAFGAYVAVVIVTILLALGQFIAEFPMSFRMNRHGLILAAFVLLVLFVVLICFVLSHIQAQTRIEASLDQEQATSIPFSSVFHRVVATFKSLSPVEVDTDNKRYAICSNSWYSLKIDDLAALASLSYFEKEEIIKYINKDNQLVTTWMLIGPSQDSYSSSIVFWHFRYVPSAVDIIVIRGTNANIDWIQNIDLWMESVLLQIYTSIIPMSSWVFRDESFASIINLCSLVDKRLPVDRRFYYHSVFNYIQKHNLHTTGKLLITGHSLGGGIAGIVGSYFNVSSVAFSAPGITYSRKKFGIKRPSIDEYTTNIIPHDDIVPKIDKQGGLLQYITCYGKTFGLNCHSVDRTLTELRENCREGSGSLLKEFKNDRSSLLENIEQLI